MDVNSQETRISELKFYNKIVKIPFVKKSYFKLLNDKYIDLGVQDILPDIKQMYEPIFREMKDDKNFDDFIKEENGEIIIKNNEKSRAYFANNLPDAVLRNMTLVKYCKNLLIFSS